MANVDPATLTWISVLFAAGSCYLLATAGRDSDGGWRLIGAFALLFVAAELDALDGAVARAYEKVSKYGDWLDHTIDRLVDLSLLIAIRINTPSKKKNPTKGYPSTFTSAGINQGNTH